MLDVRVPERLRQAVERDLRPVRPLRAPWKRAAGVAPLGVAVLVGIPLWYGLRGDAPLLGLVALWGASATLALAGLLLIGLGLRESVPARALSWPVVMGAGVATIALMVLVTAGTNALSPTDPPPDEVALYWRICFSRSVWIGSPLVLLCGVLAARALPARPEVAGALFGLGCGLLVESGWRLFCHVSDPAHVFLAHGASVLSLSALGALGAWVWERLFRPRGIR